MKKVKEIVNREWFTATLAPPALGLFTEAFYPEPKQRTGAQYVFFTRVSNTPSAAKVIVASKMADNGLRMMTGELAAKCLIPGKKASKSEMLTLNEITKNLKL